MKWHEINFDGLVGPSHHYAGLAPGNIASQMNAHTIANPQKAALQGLEKIRFLHQLGIKQAILPPHARPNLPKLFEAGFNGTPSDVIQKVYKNYPHLLRMCYSASSMWAANAATFTPSLDALDSKIHITPANLISNPHRHQEASFNELLFKKIFNHPKYFTIHPALPDKFSDEGAANHMRIAENHHKKGIHIFIYGKHHQSVNDDVYKFKPRQSLEAQKRISDRHRLTANDCFFIKQLPEAVNAGVFHNDVISTANEHVLLLHEYSFENQKYVLNDLQIKAPNLITIEVPNASVNLKHAVNSYLFNSQIITYTKNKQTGMLFLAPLECQLDKHVYGYLQSMIENTDNPINVIKFMDLKQSMKNGGGPACLRLKCLMNDEELSATHSSLIINDDLINKLTAWIKKHYRTQLSENDLGDIDLMHECFDALDDLTTILNLGSIYFFQQ